MKKILLTILFVLNIHHAHALDANQVTREKLLDSERLHEINKSSIHSASKSEVNTLKQQLKALQNGDTITIPEGKYHNFGQIVIDKDNITIKAKNAGSAWMTGLVQFKVTGDHVTLDGLVFTEGGPNERFGGVRLMGNNNTLKNTTFYYFNDDYPYEPDEQRQEYPKYLWLSLWGKNAKVINNRFEGKLKRGDLLGVQTDKTADNHLIEHNIFMDMSANNYDEFSIKQAIRYNSNTWEAVRIGNSTSSIYPSNTKFNENLMINMDGEHELLSLKSGDNTISGNTIFSSAGLISLRHGKRNHVENNVILGNKKALTGGIRVYDTDHVINNNYISGIGAPQKEVNENTDIRGAIVINTGIIDVTKGEKLSQDIKGKELNKQWTPQNIEISHNSIINAQWGIVHGSQVHRVSLYNNDEVKGIHAGDQIHFSHNLVKTNDPTQIAVRASGQYPLTNSHYDNEIYSGKLIEPEQLSNYSTIMPKLTTINGFISATKQGADVTKLKIITADIAGPGYVLK